MQQTFILCQSLKIENTNVINTTAYGAQKIKVYTMKSERTWSIEMQPNTVAGYEIWRKIMPWIELSHL